jgi:PAS domain S-box-containing protein
MHEVEYLDKLCNTADGVFIINENQRIIRWNSGAEKLLGYPETEVLNHHCYQIIGGRTSPDKKFCHPNCKIHGAGIKGSPQDNFDIQVQTNKGAAVWLNVTVLSNTDPETPFIAHILRDITKGKTTILALEQFLSNIKPPSSESSAVFPKALEDKPPASVLLPESNSPATSLSEREVEVLTLLAEGLPTKTLAQKLNISHFTARNHIQNILVKLNLHSKAQAVSYAFKKGIL